ncbi:MAG: DUF2807 domain-containing protein [Proteobacteria bacterium]|nr:DUF2807 domain-containing protein [Pseudomonadota bacterium]
MRCPDAALERGQLIRLPMLGKVFCSTAAACYQQAMKRTCSALLVLFVFATACRSAGSEQTSASPSATVDHAGQQAGVTVSKKAVNTRERASAGSSPGDCVSGQGAITTQKRELPAFTKVLNQGSAAIHLTQGTPHSARVEAHPNILPLVRVEVSGRTLTIATKGCTRDAPVRVHITAESFAEIISSGSGDIAADQTIKGERLAVTTNGSGGLSMAVAVDELLTRIRGSGGATLRGQAKAHSISLLGSGAVKATDLATEQSDVSISGSGDATVHATSALRVRVAGSGDVKYRGNPPAVDTKVSGSGDVSPL